MCAAVGDRRFLWAVFLLQACFVHGSVVFEPRPRCNSTRSLEIIANISLSPTQRTSSARSLISRARSLISLQPLGNAGDEGESLSHKVDPEGLLHQFVVPEDKLLAARSAPRNSDRLQQFMDKLLTGQAVSVTTIGGSISANAGAHHPTAGYVSRVYDWINTTFPNAAHNLTNAARGGSSSQYYSSCLSGFVQPNVDLVIVEFTLNDYHYAGNGKLFSKDARSGYEVILRKLLSTSSAVLVVHWYSPILNHGTFWDTAEDELEVLLNYYQVPSLSWRNAMFKSMAAEEEGFSYEQMYCDSVHPNTLGHRYLSDIVIARLQDVSTAPTTDTNAKDDLLQLPPPVTAIHDESEMCYKEDDFKDMVLDSKDWEWVNEGRHGDNKVGFISTTPNTSLVFQVPPKECPGGQAWIGIGHLKSYEHMGMAALRCSSGCSCNDTVMDSHYGQPFSMLFWYYAPLTLESDHCVVELQNLPETSSGEHKVKVSSFFVSCFNPAGEH